MAVPSEKYFPATVSCQVHKIGSLIKDKLTKDQLQMFEKTIFGPLLNVNMVFNGQLIHHFLLRQIPEDGNADGICFSVLGKNVRFTQKEFNIITGLWPTNNPLEKDCDSKRLQSLLFGSENKKVITCLEIEEIFKNFEFTNDDDAVKVALAVFIETVMVGKDKKTQFDMDILGRVDDEEAFKSFDWSTFFYTRLLNSLKTSLQGKKEAYELKKTRSSKAVSYYNIKGYVLAFQTGINKPDCIVWNHIFDTHLVTPDNKKAEWTDPTAHLSIWTEKDVEYYFNTAVGDYNDIPGWGDVNYVITCINIKEHWLAIAADMRKCRIYVFDSMPNYVEQKLVDEALQMPARCIASLAIAIGVNLHSDRFTYGPWPIRRSKATLQKGRSLDCGIFCTKFVECLVTASDLGCLTVPNMKLFRQQYVLELWANKYFC
uniref:Ulp1 peptidase-like n=1 Tax=Cucumis melo TaxID=3656 RepID=Q5GIT0_CUCME|nr:Ulp1-like peptidase [Cucumis melo]AAU04775.1 Ulp1 peptidase-like [Cucumis melo]